ncbi:VWA domain-containing protein [Thermodesulfobacteriota bacterium]
MRINNYIYLLAIVLYAAYLLYRRRSAGKAPSSLIFSNVANFSDIRKSRAVRIFGNLKFLKAAALFMLLIALMRPQLSDVKMNTETFGIDILLALDVSGSMEAEDFEPNNRLFVAKEVLKEFIKSRSFDRLGLVVFAGKSYTQSPLTTDYNILLNILEEVDFNFKDEGTAIGLAISESLNRLKESNAKSKVMILLTDGENNKGSIDPILAAKLAKAIDVRIYTIGIGSGEGMRVPGAKGGYARGKDGSIVVTKLNEEPLINIARITDGEYFKATNREALLEVYERISELEKSKIEMTKYFSYYELFTYFAFTALILLFLEILLTTTRFSSFP